MSERAVNTVLRELITESGATYEALARDICRIAAENRDRRNRANKSSISQWIGGVQPKPATARYLAEALSRRLGRRIRVADLGLLSKPADHDGLLGRSDPVAAIAALGRSDVDRRTLLGSTVVFSLAALTGPLTAEPAARAAAAQRRAFPAVGAGEVKAVRTMLEAFNSADEQLGGGHGRTVVAEYLATDVSRYLDGTFSSDDVRRDMFSAAAQMAYLVGWKSNDLGKSGLAQGYYLHAEELAGEATPGQRAYCMRILAHQAMDLGHHRYCADLAEKALDLTKGKVDRETESLFWLTAGRAYAIAGSARQARAMLRKAERVLARSRADKSPDWVSLGGSPQARVANQTGKTLRALGELAAAETQFTVAAGSWDPQTHPRIYALSLAELAEVQCARGAVEKACTNWNTMMDAIGAIQSARTHDAVSTLRASLAPYRGRNIPAVRDLDARAAAFLQSSTL